MRLTSTTIFMLVAGSRDGSKSGGSAAMVPLAESASARTSRTTPADEVGRVGRQRGQREGALRLEGELVRCVGGHLRVFLARGGGFV